MGRRLAALAELAPLRRLRVAAKDMYLIISLLGR